MFIWVSYLIITILESHFADWLKVSKTNGAIYTLLLLLPYPWRVISGLIRSNIKYDNIHGNAFIFLLNKHIQFATTNVTTSALVQNRYIKGRLQIFGLFCTMVNKVMKIAILNFELGIFSDSLEHIMTRTE